MKGVGGIIICLRVRVSALDRPKKSNVQRLKFLMLAAARMLTAFLFLTLDTPDSYLQERERRIFSEEPKLRIR